MPTNRGRCVSIEDGACLFQGEGGLARVPIGDCEVRVGDVVEVVGGTLVVRTPARTPDAGRTARRILDPRRLRAMDVRDRVEEGIRGFFRGRGFRETRTPILAPSPGMEPHIKPFALVGGGFLHTSPEFAMKRLLVGGLERIFQMGPVFRDEPAAPTHRPEFVMLEWYRAFAGYAEIMRDVEELFAELAERIHGRPALPWRGGSIDVRPPWPRLAVRDLFRDHVGVDVGRDDLREACARLGIAAAPDDGWDDLYFRIWLERIEPRLPADRAVIVHRYPASQAALAVIDDDPDGSRWARRFEVYAGGLELGNAFEELTDPVEQRARFVEDQALRARLFGDRWPISPIPEELLAALEEGMPPSGGIAMGVDRVAMLFADAPDIDLVTWL